jgi:hypothetical protein
VTYMIYFYKVGITLFGLFCMIFFYLRKHCKFLPMSLFWNVIFKSWSFFLVFRFLTLEVNCGYYYAFF